MMFLFMLLGPDLVAQKIGLLELKVGQKIGFWFKFLVRNFSLSLSLSLSRSLIIFPFMRLGPGLVPLKLQ
jgi:mannitol-specific phosphotransferase system IIBC component